VVHLTLVVPLLLVGLTEATLVITIKIMLHTVLVDLAGTFTASEVPMENLELLL
jgi:hypothetical protein